MMMNEVGEIVCFGVAGYVWCGERLGVWRITFRYPSYPNLNSPDESFPLLMHRCTSLVPNECVNFGIRMGLNSPPLHSLPLVAATYL